MAQLSSLASESYRTILESLPIGVYLVDRERRITLWNDGCEKITGYLRHEVIGRCCADDLLMHCDEKNDNVCGTGCPLSDTMRDGRPREADLFLRHKDGQRVPVRVRSVPVRDEGGAIVGACECFDERALVSPPKHPLHLVPHHRPADNDPDDLPNDHEVLQMLQEDLAEFRASHIPFGLLCLGLDKLEQLRSFDGANAVKSVFHATAQTLLKSVGPGNWLGRWSNRGFVAVVNSCTEASLLESANRMKRLVGLESVPWWGDQIHITLSAGGTLARATDTPESLIRRAAEALEKQMKNGVNQAVVV